MPTGKLIINYNTMLFQAQAIIQGISTLKDKSIKLTVYTRELLAQEKANLFALEGMEGWFLFKENEIQQEDVPTKEAEINIKKKSLSERLYNVLYVYYSQNFPVGQTNFNSWREHEMEKIIESYKSKLN